MEVGDTQAGRGSLTSLNVKAAHRGPAPIELPKLCTVTVADVSGCDRDMWLEALARYTGDYLKILVFILARGPKKIDFFVGIWHSKLCFFKRHEELRIKKRM